MMKLQSFYWFEMSRRNVEIETTYIGRTVHQSSHFKLHRSSLMDEDICILFEMNYTPKKRLGSLKGNILFVVRFDIRKTCAAKHP